ncbi:MAG: VCBS repeat-containing protein [Planctomycetes bacterium]|nr:VCBS repeat-containing protein [Planctomycetota bacterium]
MSQRVTKWLCLSVLLLAAGGAGCPFVPDDGTGFPRRTIWTQRTVNDSAALRPVFTALSDMDGDTKLDIIAAYVGEGGSVPTVAIFFQDTTESYTAVTIGAGNDLAGVAALAIGDLNGDGRRDVIAGCDNAIVYLLNPASSRTAGDWTRSTLDNSNGATSGVWVDVAIGEIDGVNGPDVVGCNQNFSRWCWFKSPAANITTGTGWTRTDVDNANRSGAAGVALADFNSDNKLDVICTSTDANIEPRIAWYRNPATPTNAADWSKFRVGNLPSASRVIVADLNADGRSDVVTMNAVGRQIGWYQRPSDATAAWSGFVLAQFATAIPVDVKASDIDGNGQVDIVVAAKNSGLFRWFTPTSTGPNPQWIENALIDFNNLTPGRFALGDIDNDTRPDIAAPLQGVTTAGDIVVWLENPES